MMKSYVLPLLSLLLMVVGLTWIIRPQKIFYIRNFPGVDSEMEMNDWGVLMYQSVGFVITFIGIFLLVYWFVVILS